ncbi:NAD(P)/FAD-dependent oxidoreductase [Ochrovirga pacifica]|uniref:NAD(P)/FAD-dependent oxidoreductase n=1 Tax=Ochrovirga pacifica TaxID=1042376 RepID=UPI0002557B76|nr:NAD(P)/FAD-dependent oxidoreductase [Ochrovirga pacifica]
MKTKNFDVIIIGGSYAGLSAALALGRSLRKVLVIDAGKPCNRQTPHSHNFLTQDGSTPKQIAEIAKNQILNYKNVVFYNGIATGAKKINSDFEVNTDKQMVFTAKKLILATGIKDLFPNIKGFKECWGISVVHCPYCHGYEIRNQKTALIANGDHAMHLLGLIQNLGNQVTITTHGKAKFTEEQQSKLEQHQIEVIEKEIAEINHHNGFVESIRFSDNSIVSYQSAYTVVPFEQNTQIPKLLGCEINEQGYIKVDAMQKTNITGVYACGDNSSMRSVATAVYTGNIAGVVANKELVNDEF